MNDYSAPISTFRLVRSVVGLVALLVLAFVLIGCGVGTSGSKNVFRLGTTEKAITLNPLKPSGGTDLLVWREIYPQLVTYDANLSPAPSLASSWDVSPDGRRIVFHLRSGAKWSDGQPLTARDAAFTINTIVKFKDGAAGAAASGVQGITSATAIDDTTLNVDFTDPTADALGNMAYQLFILPEHIWSAKTSGDGQDLQTFDNYPDPVTSGPFKIVRWAPEFVLTKRDDSYWGTKPKIEGFGVQYFANDESMISALRTDSIDGVRIPSPIVIDAAKRAGMVVDTAPSVGYQTIEINSNPDKTQHRELLDPRVRLALDTAIDRTRIVSEANLGYGQPGVGVITPASQYFDRQLTAPNFDIAAANKILDEAGYPRGTDGVRLASGSKMSYDFNFPSTMRGSGDRTFALLKQAWGQLGIEIKPKYIDAAANLADVQGPNGTYQSFDIGFWDWVAIPPEPGFILGVQTCSARTGWSDTGYCNADYDDLYAKQAVQMNRAQRQQTLDTMQRMLQDERGVMVFYTVPSVALHGKEWSGVVLTPLQAFELPITWTALQRNS